MHLLRLVIKANYSLTKAAFISEAVVEYEVQRVFLRLAFEHKLLSPRQFAYGSAKLDEIGRLLRGWQANRQKIQPFPLERKSLGGGISKRQRAVFLAGRATALLAQVSGLSFSTSC
ncbi:hypothetical protein COY17_01620 [Candidatus Saccharibacteria bacterium CG_4_10_14_0_2_um_filter_52_9]|nr:MAG: hypothetical protein COY17_01620 [Candidatus Saccharibacteria bacterium CG_4_10_14_0_2_um_filter_52_9]